MLFIHSLSIYSLYVTTFISTIRRCIRKKHSRAYENVCIPLYFAGIRRGRPDGQSRRAPRGQHADERLREPDLQILWSIHKLKFIFFLGEKSYERRKNPSEKLQFLTLLKHTKQRKRRRKSCNEYPLFLNIHHESHHYQSIPNIVSFSFKYYTYIHSCSDDLNKILLDRWVTALNEEKTKLKLTKHFSALALKISISSPRERE